jgi:flagellum-specific peptidoglycan hydrolase FlgJ
MINNSVNGASMNKLTPEIISWAQQGIVPAALKIAAAMEESGLGVHTPPGSNNWFGIKDSSGVETETKEQTSGGVWYTIKAGFRVYKTPADGFADYDHLISTGKPYAKAWKTWLNSPKTNADVEMLTRSIAVRYATALSYAKALVSLEVEEQLFNYDKEA